MDAQQMNPYASWSHENMSQVDKTPGRDDGSVSGLSDGQGSTAASKKRMSSASDMSKQHVEELVTRLMIGEMKSRWVDEIFAKVKTELVDYPQVAISDTLDTPSTEAAHSPRVIPAEVDTGSQRGAYQATVEDEPEDNDESGSRAQDSARGSLSNNDSVNSPASSVVSESTSSRASGLPSSRRASALEVPSLESPCPSPKTRPTVRFSDRGPVILQGRPKPLAPRLELPGADPNDTALSAVDIKWGRLFDERGEPTARLGQFLRGIANYLIAEYTPNNSLVITPEKLHAFYSRYKLQSESLPFQSMFDSRNRKEFASLEYLYQDLQCSYHLVQGRSHSTPRIPALTPSGFEDWMVGLIRAFPDQEAKRLSYIVAELPIAADGPLLDGKAERLPKQLSRHLLPTSHHREVHELVTMAVHDWIKSVGLTEPSARKEARSDDGSRSARPPRDDNRHRSDDYRGEGSSSRHYHRSRNSYSKSGDRGSSSRKDPPSRFVSRANSEGNVRRSEPSPPPHKSRSPASGNRYRSSATSLGGGAPDDYGLSSPSHLSSSPSQQHFPRGSSGEERRNREQDYRYYQGRASSDATPRTVVGSSRRQQQPQNLVVDTKQPRDDAGPSYDEYARTSPRVSRSSVGGEDGGPYRTAHSGGAG